MDSNNAAVILINAIACCIIQLVPIITPSLSIYP